MNFESFLYFIIKMHVIKNGFLKNALGFLNAKNPNEMDKMNSL